MDTFIIGKILYSFAIKKYACMYGNNSCFTIYCIAQMMWNKAISVRKCVYV